MGNRIDDQLFEEPKNGCTHLVIFDIDGTLVDSDEYDATLFKQAVRDVLNIEIGDDWSSYRNVTDGGILDEIIDIHGINDNRNTVHEVVEKQFFELNESYLAERPGAMKEIPGARDFIERLSNMESVMIAIATGGWEETARMRLEGVGIKTGNLILTSSSDSHCRTEIMKLAENRVLAGRDVAKKTYFGDGVWDKQACKELDYDFIAIGNNVEHNTRFADFLTTETIFSHLGL